MARHHGAVGIVVAGLAALALGGAAVRLGAGIGVGAAALALVLLLFGRSLAALGVLALALLAVLALALRALEFESGDEITQRPGECLLVVQAFGQGGKPPARLGFDEGPPQLDHALGRRRRRDAGEAFARQYPQGVGHRHLLAAGHRVEALGAAMLVDGAAILAFTPASSRPPNASTRACSTAL